MASTGPADWASAETAVSAASSTSSQESHHKETALTQDLGTKIGAKNGEHVMRDTGKGREYRAQSSAAMPVAGMSSPSKASTVYIESEERRR